jgi:hypothetical protein
MTNLTRIVRISCASAVMALVSIAPASAHRDRVVEDDPALVTERLHRMGFVEWRKLRWDDGTWKIDDARRENGHTYDLQLEGGTFDLVRLKRERI